MIIGNSSISHSAIQVMNMLTPFKFEYVDSSDFDKLEGFHESNDIDGIILTPPDEVELAKHIRLTDSLGKLRLLPIMILSPHSIEHHLREKRDNVFLLSPEIYLIPVSGFIPKLSNVIEKAVHFESSEKMRTDLKPYIVWSEEDDIVSSHDNFNRYGPFKLLKGHFSQLPEQLSREYEGMASRLWFKKYQFLETQNLRPEVPPADEELFRKTIANKKILYIDDEHRLGWSFALFSILSVDTGITNYVLFQNSSHFIETPDKRLSCIDNYDEAVKALDHYRETLSRSLSDYSEAEHSRNMISEEFRVAQQRFQEIENKYKAAKANLERSEANFRETETRLKEILVKVKDAMSSFDNAYVSAFVSEQEKISIPDMMPYLRDLSDLEEQYSKESTLFEKYREEQRRNRELFDNLNGEFETKKSLSQEAEAGKTAASKRYDEALRALTSGRLFPFDLIILDLRLEKTEDRDALPYEISGVKLLKQIKDIDPSVPVLVFTASQKAMNYKEVRELGASGYWIKVRNSLNELKNEIIKSLRNANDFRNIWFNIRRIEAKKQLSGFSENTYTKNFEKRVVSDFKKKEIVSLLKESFLLLTKELTPYEQSICNYNNFSKIAINMGLIMEVRYDNIRGEKWDQWARQNKIDKDEQRIRQMRNKAAHETGSNISYQEALEVFQKTLERCLKT